MSDIEILIDLNAMKEIIDNTIKAAIRLPSDVNGNPRYYISCVNFIRDKDFFRPANCSAYRGKQYGRGWTFQTYSLRDSVRIAYETEYNIKMKDLPEPSQDSIVLTELKKVAANLYSLSRKAVAHSDAHKAILQAEKVLIDHIMTIS